MAQLESHVDKMINEQPEEEFKSEIVDEEITLPQEDMEKGVIAAVEKFDVVKSFGTAPMESKSAHSYDTSLGHNVDQKDCEKETEFKGNFAFEEKEFSEFWLYG